MAAAQIPVVITYHKPGTRPPIFVAGTFSNPPWQPQEMEHTTRTDGEYDFKKEVYGEPGSKIQYKFRIGNGDWWVLNGDAPTMTDSAGNTNHVLEVKPLKEQQPRGQQDMGDDTGFPKLGKPLPKHLQPAINAEVDHRSGTSTPDFVRTAAEVAESAALLHEEVPRRQTPRVDSWSSNARKGTPTPLSEDAETAAEVAGTAETLDNDENPILIFEQPPGESVAFEVQGPGEESFGDQDGYIADKSPLFAHECVGLYESDEEAGPANNETEDYVGGPEPKEDIDPDKLDLNDPTLERFPSRRDDIIDTMRKLETGLQVDQSFEATSPSPVFNPSRRGTEDITGDFALTAASPPSPAAQRSSKNLDVPRSPRASESGPASGSLHSISEAEEPTGDDEVNFPPAVVFSNPVEPKPKNLKLPFNHEDEGIVLPDGVSPMTATPEHRITTPEASPVSRKRAELGGTPSGAPDINAPKAGDTESSKKPSDSATTTGTAAAKAGNSEQLRRRGAQDDPPKTPDSVHLTGVQASQGRSWIRAFLKLLFVDLIGGLINRLTGGKRKT
ncbi:hypothetical protein MFIFM68171_10773 [Madurella fahalii]|uniref:AMP-activated protein kinase glycogen-binding domain-containing protein n=1 Tax=Madurella fahalii TaxID=1157608 RepID=A0ABQ0GS53_9PEZI